MSLHHQQWIFFIDPAVIRSCLVPFLNFVDVKNLILVSKEFNEILTHHDQDSFSSCKVNVGDSAVIDLLKRYSEDSSGAKDSGIGSMINLASGVNIASYWSLSPQSFSLFSNNCKIIGKFLQKRAEERGGGVGSLLELAPEFDFQKLVLITNWCDIPIHSLIINHSKSSEKKIDSKSNAPMTRYLIQKSGCKETIIKVSLGEVASYIFVNYFMECCKSCEKISFKFIAKHGHGLVTCYDFEYSKTSPLIVESIRLKCVRSDDDLKQIVKFEEMLNSVKRLEFQNCITNAFNGIVLNNLEYMKVEDTTSSTINLWKMPKLQTYICKNSSTCQNLQHAENLQELIVDHQRILNFKVVK